MVQWQRLRDSNAEGLGSIPGQGTRPHILQLKVFMSQLRVCIPQLKIPCATPKTWHSQKKKKNLKKINFVQLCVLKGL